MLGTTPKKQKHHKIDFINSKIFTKKNTESISVLRRNEERQKEKFSFVPYDHHKFLEDFELQRAYEMGMQFDGLLSCVNVQFSIVI
jgi:hypothetical protein